mmetsp:Transcript_56059/g.174106  ORF Transcript_56059/g.174106 Transcript_56059/m.174106 type:complete len:283 (-) Transcript_56059:13-861(-)
MQGACCCGTASQAVLAEVRSWIAAACKIPYADRVRLEVDGGADDGGGCACAHSPRMRVWAEGPDSVLRMLLLALRREVGQPVARERRLGRASRAALEAMARLAAEAAASPVAPETFEVNLVLAAPPFGVVFLDVDGVLNTSQGVGAGPLQDTQLWLLVGLVRSAGARLVLSSAWRERWDLRLRLWTALVEAGLAKDCIVGQTPVLAHARRACEVLAWLDRRPGHAPSRWVVLDDLDLGFTANCKTRGRFVKVSSSAGLTRTQVDAAQALLADCGTAEVPGQQ